MFLNIYPNFVYFIDALFTCVCVGSNKSNMDPALINFKVLYVLTQLCGLTMIVLVGTWIGQHFGGLGGTDHPKQEFNWHPLFMTIGFIYLYGNCKLSQPGCALPDEGATSLIF